jgi:hypothetical protein
MSKHKHSGATSTQWEGDDIICERGPRLVADLLFGLLFGLTCFPLPQVLVPYQQEGMQDPELEPKLISKSDPDHGSTTLLQLPLHRPVLCIM